MPMPEKGQFFKNVDIEVLSDKIDLVTIDSEENVDTLTLQGITQENFSKLKFQCRDIKKDGGKVYAQLIDTPENHALISNADAFNKTFTFEPMELENSSIVPEANISIDDLLDEGLQVMGKKRGRGKKAVGKKDVTPKNTANTGAAKKSSLTKKDLLDVLPDFKEEDEEKEPKGNPSDMYLLLSAMTNEVVEEFMKNSQITDNAQYNSDPFVNSQVGAVVDQFTRLTKEKKQATQATRVQSQFRRFLAAKLATKKASTLGRGTAIKKFNEARTRDQDDSIASISTNVLSSHVDDTTTELESSLKTSEGTIKQLRDHLKAGPLYKTKGYRAQWRILSTYLGPESKLVKSNLTKLLIGDTASLTEDTLKQMLTRINSLPEPTNDDTPAPMSAKPESDDIMGFAESSGGQGILSPQDKRVIFKQAKDVAVRLIKNQQDILSKRRKIAAVKGYSDAIASEPPKVASQDLSAPQGPLAVSSFSSRPNDMALSASSNYLDFAKSIEKIASRGLLSAENDIDYVAPLSVVTPDSYDDDDFIAMRRLFNADAPKVLDQSINHLDSLITDAKQVASSPVHFQLLKSLGTQKTNLVKIKHNMDTLKAQYDTACQNADLLKAEIYRHLKHSGLDLEQVWKDSDGYRFGRQHPLKSGLTFKGHKQKILAEIASLSSCAPNDIPQKETEIFNLWRDYISGLQGKPVLQMYMQTYTTEDSVDTLFFRFDSQSSLKNEPDSTELENLIKQAKSLNINLDQVKEAYVAADAQNDKIGSPDGATVLTDAVCKRLSIVDQPLYTNSLTALQEKSAGEVENLYFGLTEQLTKVKSESEAYKANFTQLVDLMNAKRDIALQMRASFRLQQLREKNGLDTPVDVDKIDIDPLVTLNQSYEEALALMINNQFEEAVTKIKNCFDPEATCDEEANRTRALLSSLDRGEKELDIRRKMLESANGNFDMLCNDLFPGKDQRGNDECKEALSVLKNKLKIDLTPELPEYDSAAEPQDKAQRLQEQVNAINAKIALYNALFKDMKHSIDTENVSDSVREFRAAAMRKLAEFVNDKSKAPHHLKDFKESYDEVALHDFFNLSEEGRSLLEELHADIQGDIAKLNTAHKDATSKKVGDLLRSQNIVGQIKRLKDEVEQLPDPEHHIFKAALEKCNKDTLEIGKALDAVETAEKALEEKLGGRTFATMHKQLGQFKAELGSLNDLLGETHLHFKEDGKFFSETRALLNTSKGEITKASEDIDWESLEEQINNPEDSAQLKGAFNHHIAEIYHQMSIVSNGLQNNQTEPNILAALENQILTLENISTKHGDTKHYFESTLETIRKFQTDYMTLYGKSKAFQTLGDKIDRLTKQQITKQGEQQKVENDIADCEKLQKSLVVKKGKLVAVIDNSYDQDSFYDELMENNVEHYTLEDGTSKAGVEFAKKHRLGAEDTALISKMIRHGGATIPTLTSTAIGLYECVPKGLRTLLASNPGLRGQFSLQKFHDIVNGTNLRTGLYPYFDNTLKKFIQDQLMILRLGEDHTQYCAELYMQDEEFQEVINAKLTSTSDTSISDLEPAIKKAEQRSKIRGFAVESADKADKADEAEVKDLQSFEEEINGFQIEMANMKIILRCSGTPEIVHNRRNKLNIQLEQVLDNGLNAPERKESLKYFKSQVQKFKKLVNERIHLAHDAVSTMAKDDHDAPVQLSSLATAYVEQVSDLAKDNRRRILGLIPPKFIPFNKYFDADLDASTASLKKYISKLRDAKDTAQLRALVESLNNNHNATMGGSPDFATADTFTDSIASEDRMDLLADQLNSRLSTLGASLRIEGVGNIKQLPEESAPTTKTVLEEGELKEGDLETPIEEGGTDPDVGRLVSQKDRFDAICVELSSQYKQFNVNQNEIDMLESKDQKTLEDYYRLEDLKVDNEAIISKMDKLNEDISAHNRSVLGFKDGLLNRMLKSLGMGDKVPTFRGRLWNALKALAAAAYQVVYNAVSTAYTMAKSVVMSLWSRFQESMHSAEFAPGSVWSTKMDLFTRNYSDEGGKTIGPRGLFAFLNFQISSVDKVEANENEYEDEIKAKIHQGTLDDSIDKYLAEYSLEEIKGHFSFEHMLIGDTDLQQKALDAIDKNPGDLRNIIKNFLQTYKDTLFSFDKGEMHEQIQAPREPAQALEETIDASQPSFLERITSTRKARQQAPHRKEDVELVELKRATMLQSPGDQIQQRLGVANDAVNKIIQEAANRVTNRELQVGDMVKVSGRTGEWKIRGFPYIDSKYVNVEQKNKVILTIKESLTKVRDPKLSAVQVTPRVGGLLAQGEDLKQAAEDAVDRVTNEELQKGDTVKVKDDLNEVEWEILRITGNTATLVNTNPFEGTRELNRHINDLSKVDNGHYPAGPGS